MGQEDNQYRNSKGGEDMTKSQKQSHSKHFIFDFCHMSPNPFFV
ncbi:hypothetical protein NSP_16390 [Nodularia spumigena CCY9414]|nr:hypothetical protein NSP_16390 [Nodularia spumigena CCY9414]